MNLSEDLDLFMKLQSSSWIVRLTVLPYTLSSFNFCSTRSHAILSWDSSSFKLLVRNPLALAPAYFFSVATFSLCTTLESPTAADKMNLASHFIWWSSQAHTNSGLSSTSFTDLMPSKPSYISLAGPTPGIQPRSSFSIKSSTTLD